MNDKLNEAKSEAKSANAGRGLLALMVGCLTIVAIGTVIVFWTI